MVLTLAAQRGLPLFAIPLAASVITQAEYGVAALLISIGAVASVLLELGVSRTLPRLYFDGGSALGKERQTWAALYIVQLGLLSVVGAVTILTFAVLIVADYVELAGFIVATATYGCTLSWLMTVQSFNVTRGRTARIVFAAAVQLAVALGLVAPLSSVAGASGYVLALSAGALGAIIVSQPYSGIQPNWDRPELRSGLRLSVVFLGQGLSVWLLSLFDRIAISAFMGALALGVYQVSYMFGSVIGLALAALQLAWAPRYYSSRAREKAFHLYRLRAPFALMASATAIMVSAWADRIVGALMPSFKLEPAVVALVAASCVARAYYFVDTVELLDQKRAGAVATSTAWAAGTSVTGLILLTPLLGLKGAALVAVIAYIVQAVVVQFSVGYRSLRHIATILLATGITASICIAATAEPVLIGSTAVAASAASIWWFFARLGATTAKWEQPTDSPRYLKGPLPQTG